MTGNTLGNSKVNSELRSSGNVFSWKSFPSQNDFIALLLEELSVGHEFFRVRVRMKFAVGTVKVEPGQIVLSVEKLKADEVIRFHSIRNRHDGRDVSQSPLDGEIVLVVFRRLRQRCDEARELSNISDFEPADVDWKHPSCFGNVEVMFVVFLASAASSESVMPVDTVGPVVKVLPGCEPKHGRRSKVVVIVVFSLA